jgi:hypothetical protein
MLAFAGMTFVKVFMQAVKRNHGRFPPGFTFQKNYLTRIPEE